LSADRAHKTKKNRPFAAGLLPLELGLLLFVGLVVLSMSIAFLGIHSRFGWVLLLYLVFTLVYSFHLKRKVVLDVIVLAGLYTHRIIAGGIAAQVEISSWLLAFSMFIFMSLAFLKRYVELLQLNEQKEIKNRNYVVDDVDMVASVGPTSGYLAVLVFALYIQSDATRMLYKTPSMLWLICPVLLYWITRVWFLARRGQMADDPVQFALTDSVSWWTILLIVSFMAIANSFVL
jgi:4-hydroxybenzoate polyprenyltransferase